MVERIFILISYAIGIMDNEQAKRMTGIMDTRKYCLELITLRIRLVMLKDFAWKLKSKKPYSIKI